MLYVQPDTRVLVHSMPVWYNVINNVINDNEHDGDNDDDESIID